MRPFPLRGRYIGLESIGGRWRVYLVLPSKADFRTLVSKTVRVSRPQALLAIVFLALLVSADQAPQQVPAAWDQALARLGAGTFRVEQQGSVRLTSLTVRLKDASWEIIPAGADRREGETSPIDRIAAAFSRRTGRDVAGAVNGGFFDVKTGLPIGFLLRDGEMDFFNMPQGVRRSMVGFTRPAPGAPARVVISSPRVMPKAWLDCLTRRGSEVRESLALHHVNVAGGRDAFGLFTPQYGTLVNAMPKSVYFLAEREGLAYRIVRRCTGASRLRIPENGLVIAMQGDSRGLEGALRIGQRVKPRWALPDEWTKAGVVHGLLAGPRLLQDGAPAVTAKEERLLSLKSRDRVVLGHTPDGETRLVWMHETQPGLMMDFDRAARLLAGLGLRDAIALDGGSSRSLLAVAGDPYRSDRYLYKGRPVANALMLVLPPARHS